MKLPKVARVSQGVKRDGRFLDYLMVLALSVVIGMLTTGSGRASSVLPSGGAIATATVSGSTLSVPRPVGVVAGDVLIASVDARLSAEASITAPTGWILIRRDSSTPPGSLTQALYYKVAGSAEPTTYAWLFAAPASAAGSVVDFKGLNRSSPVDSHSGAFTPASRSVIAPSVTTTASDDIVVGFFGLTGGRTVRPPTGMTEQFELHSRSWSSPLSVEGAAYIQSGAGPTGNKMATASGVWSSSTIGQLVALRTIGSASPPQPPSSPSTAAPSTTSHLHRLLLRRRRLRRHHHQRKAPATRSPSRGWRNTSLSTSIRRARRTSSSTASAAATRRPPTGRSRSTRSR